MFTLEGATYSNSLYFLHDLVSRPNGKQVRGKMKHQHVIQMKTLFIIRHAKSSWDNPDQADLDRPLNDRGERDAPTMGKRLKEKEIHPDLIVSSPAKRALSTGKRMAEILNYPKENIKTIKALYHADEDTLLDTVQNLTDNYEVVMLFGHNPGLTDFVNALSEADTCIDNLPTCGVVAFTFSAESWSDMSWKKGKLILFDYPKRKED